MNMGGISVEPKFMNFGGEEKLLMEMVKLEKRVREEISALYKDLDKPYSRKRLKLNNGISMAAQEDQASLTEIGDGVSFLSRAESDEIGMNEKPEELRSFEFDKECNSTNGEQIAGGTRWDDEEEFEMCSNANVDPLFDGTRCDSRDEREFDKESASAKVDSICGSAEFGITRKMKFDKEWMSCYVDSVSRRPELKIPSIREFDKERISTNVVLDSHATRSDILSKREFDKERTSTRVDSVFRGTKLDIPSEKEPHKECGNTNADLVSGPTKLETPTERFPDGPTNPEEFPPLSRNEKLINFDMMQDDHRLRRRVIEVLKEFKQEYKIELREGNNTQSPHLEAAKHVKAKGMHISTRKPFGHVPGVKIGDGFSFRVELSIVGLHRQSTSGIDFVNLGCTQYATSIVDSGRYENESRRDDILIYSGQGGNPRVGTGVYRVDQKLKKGNLALMNSMKMGFPVRVIQRRKRVKGSKTLGMKGKCDYIFVYDGLYKVNRLWNERKNENSNLVFKFELQRLSC